MNPQTLWHQSPLTESENAGTPELYDSRTRTELPFGTWRANPTSGNLKRVPSEFLVVYDYGMGGLWAVVFADSADEITTRYPEVGIATDRPAWMDDADLERLRREVVDINAPEDEGIFKAVVADRSK